ncbi:MAG: hypothetical protein ACYC6Y_22545, partial [Thermoguttaceae bacterium]
FLSNINIHEVWPYPNFDTAGRQRQVIEALGNGCPAVGFIPVTVEKPADVEKAVALKDQVDGFLVYAMTLDWSQTQALVKVGQLGKPTIIADEFLGGSGVFLTGVSGLRSRKVPVAAVSSRRLDDLVTVARQFATVHQPGTTPESFARDCDEAYRKTFPAPGEAPRAGGQARPAADALTLSPIDECVKRFHQSRFLIVGRGKGGDEVDYLGVKARFVDFDELESLYQQVDRDEAARWVDRWSKEASPLPAGQYVDPREPQPGALDEAARVYLATVALLKKYGTDSVTMNCLGGFAAGNLPAYPCLGFRQILDDGGQGVCEAMPDDTLSMLMARILTGRPGFVSDPAIDTSTNQICYSHCVSATKVFGPQREASPFHIRTLHNRDPRGTCAESLLPGGYMTTTFRTNVARKELVVHQARAVGPLDTERGCRTKLMAEVSGDIGRLFDQWDLFGWHRVTVYGDVLEPLSEFGRALGLKVIQEA